MMPHRTAFPSDREIRASLNEAFDQFAGDDKKLVKNFPLYPEEVYPGATQDSLYGPEGQDPMVRLSYVEDQLTVRLQSVSREDHKRGMQALLNEIRAAKAILVVQRAVE
jgi:hypothetical protein